MRTPSVTRLYLQCPPDDSLEQWPDDRVWSELRVRLETTDGWTLQDGRVLEKGLTMMRSSVMEPMQWGRLFLAGDAAHVVPPTGAKGMNLAIADVKVLGDAIAQWYRMGDRSGLDSYSATCLRRVWRAEHFSWWMTSMLHRAPGDDGFQHKLQLAQLRYLIGSRAAATSLAENYVGYDHA
jgi:p-hydroxybenzoate 3-monooxygenase